MRIVGQFEDDHVADGYCALLRAASIEVETRPARAGGTLLFVVDDERLEDARALIDNPELRPATSAWQEAVARARAALKNLPAKPKAKQAPPRRRPPLVGRGLAQGTRGTLVLIALCLAVAVLSRLGSNQLVFRSLAIDSGATGLAGTFDDVLKGQLWRLFTPVLLHFSILHIAFNLMWLLSLGGSIERAQGTRFLLIFVGLTGICSNCVQYVVQGPYFGGMSGVVYALFGYVWMCSRYHPASPYRIDGQSVALMLLWLGAGFTGLVGPIANGAHLSGLVAGTVWGLVRSKTAL